MRGGAELVWAMRQHLRQERRGKLPAAYFQHVGYEPVQLQLQCMQTAAVARWWRPPSASGAGEVIAASVILSGIDAWDDRKASKALQRMEAVSPLGRRFRDEILPLIERVPRPMVASCFADRWAFERRWVSHLASGMAAAFFAQFGDAMRWVDDAAVAAMQQGRQTCG